MSDKAKKSSSTKKFLFQFFLPLLLIVPTVIFPLTIGVIFTIQNGEPLKHAIPYALLFTGFRETTRQAWKIFGTPLDMHADYKLTEIPSIDAKDYSHDKLRQLTQNFRYPAVVRGLFKDTPATQKWSDREYLKTQIGEHEVPVVMNARYGTVQTNRTNMKFADAWDMFMDDPKSLAYLFFPFQNRPSKDHYGSWNDAFERLTKGVNNLVFNDLELNKRIWNGFATPYHTAYIGSQLVIGKGSNNVSATTGSGWHCAMGSNYFVQTVGRKRWYFIHPKYTYLLKPLRIGVVAFMISYDAPGFQYYPTRYVDLEPGDMLYNPDYEWHTIVNYEGLSIGVPVREFNATFPLRNNLLFASVAYTNKLVEKLTGTTFGGYPTDPSKKLNHD